MTVSSPPQALSTRAVFGTYAALAVSLGVIGIDGNAWVTLGAALQPATLVLHPTAASPWGQYVVPRIVGIVLLTAGILALGFAWIEDAEDRRRSLNRFACAHVVFGFFFSLVTSALLDSVLPPEIIWGPLTLGGVLALLAVAGAPGGSATRSVERLRSQYEEQIRHAARREERARLARDLHDAVKQQLFVIQTAAATVDVRLDTDQTGVRTAIDHVRTAAREAMTEMEALIDQLQAAPLENTGLVEALRKQCEALGFRTGARVNLQVGALPPSEALPPGTQDALYRFAQEALANAGRHARAKQVTVSLAAKQHQLELAIEDDGIGFDTETRSAGMGCGNMAARAGEIGGTYVLTSKPGQGTVVRCTVPRTSGRPGLNVIRTLKWTVISGAVGFLVYWYGGQGDVDYPAIHQGFEFLAALVAAVAIAILFFGIRYVVMCAFRFDRRLLASLATRPAGHTHHDSRK